MRRSVHSFFTCIKKIFDCGKLYNFSKFVATSVVLCLFDCDKILIAICWLQCFVLAQYDIFWQNYALYFIKKISNFDIIKTFFIS